MSNEVSPILRMWKLYKEDLKKLLNDPLTAAVEELEKANKSDNWEQVGMATELLSFLIKECSL